MPLRLLVVALVTALVGLGTVLPAGASTPPRPVKCDTFDQARAFMQTQDRGAGPRVAVIGDSFAVGAALPDRLTGWTSRLPGQVHVDGHSGSGFSPRSSPCGTEYAFHRRVRAATADGADLVVVQGGVNDWDRTNAEILAGFTRLVDRLDGRPALVVGPVPAPALREHLVRVNRVLRVQTRRHGIAFLPMIWQKLPYRADGVHLTPEGHVLFGDRVAAAVSALPPPPAPEE